MVTHSGVPLPSFFPTGVIVEREGSERQLSTVLSIPRWRSPETGIPGLSTAAVAMLHSPSFSGWPKFSPPITVLSLQGACYRMKVAILHIGGWVYQRCAIAVGMLIAEHIPVRLVAATYPVVG